MPEVNVALAGEIDRRIRAKGATLVAEADQRAALLDPIIGIASAAPRPLLTLFLLAPVTLGTQ